MAITTSNLRKPSRPYESFLYGDTTPGVATFKTTNGQWPMTLGPCRKISLSNRLRSVGSGVSKLALWLVACSLFYPTGKCRPCIWPRSPQTKILSAWKLTLPKSSGWEARAIPSGYLSSTSLTKTTKNLISSHPFSSSSGQIKNWPMARRLLGFTALATHTINTSLLLASLFGSLLVLQHQ